jgi:hypothetical protein
MAAVLGEGLRSGFVPTLVEIEKESIFDKPLSSPPSVEPSEETEIHFDATHRAILDRIKNLIHSPGLDSSELTTICMHLIDRVGSIETIRIFDIMVGLLNLEKQILDIPQMGVILIGAEDQNYILDVRRLNLKELNDYVTRRNKNVDETKQLETEKVHRLYEIMQGSVRSIK